MDFNRSVSEYELLLLKFKNKVIVLSAMKQNPNMIRSKSKSKQRKYYKLPYIFIENNFWEVMSEEETNNP